MPTKIDHIIFLIHPCCYEQLDAETVRKNNDEIYVEREREVKRKWLEALTASNSQTLLLQLGGPQDLFEQAKERLGEANALYVRADFPGPDQLEEYYRRLIRCIRDHLCKQGLEFDPARVSSELWGESFEGCVPGYGGAFAELLQLKSPPKMVFEMTVYNARFLYGAKLRETLTIGNSDIEALLFECYDGSSAAIFQARLTAQWLDRRPISLELDPSRVMLCSTLGYTAWPPKPWKKGDSDAPCPYKMTTADALWLRTTRMSFDDLSKLVSSAKIGNEND